MRVLEAFLIFFKKLLSGCSFAVERRGWFDDHRVKAAYDEQDSNQTPQKRDIALRSIVNCPGNHGADDGTPGLNENHDAADLGEVGAPEEFSDAGPIYRESRLDHRKQRQEEPNLPMFLSENEYHHRQHREEHANRHELGLVYPVRKPAE